jgi:NADH-quinone oxidoreductase subunit K
MSLELLFNAANVNFIVFCYGTDYRFLEGQVFALFVMAIAAAEAALGLALVIEIFRRRGTVTLSELDRLQG